MPSARKFIDEARGHLANVRKRLLHPDDILDRLEDPLPDLEQAIGLLRQAEMFLSAQAGATERSQTWESAHQLRGELARVNALARQANEFYSGRIGLLAGEDASLRYNASGAASASTNETVSQKVLVLHG